MCKVSLKHVLRMCVCVLPRRNQLIYHVDRGICSWQCTLQAFWKSSTNSADSWQKQNDELTHSGARIIRERLLKKSGKLACKYNRFINLHRTLNLGHLGQITLYLKHLFIDSVSNNRKIIDLKISMEYNNILVIHYWVRWYWVNYFLIRKFIFWVWINILCL